MDNGYEFEIKQQLQPFLQTDELKKHTEILEEAKNITLQNAEDTKEIVKCTKENQHTTNKQYSITLFISILALIIAIFSFFFSIESSQGVSHLLEKQLDNQEQIIELLK